MSKVANMLNMVEYLQDRKVHSIADISSKLEVMPSIRQYKVELEQAGIYITSTTGKYGDCQYILVINDTYFLYNLNIIR